MSRSMSGFNHSTPAVAFGLLIGLLAGTSAQADEHWRPHEFREREFREQRFLDARFHHDHYYPAPGFVFGAIPPGFHVVARDGRRFCSTRSSMRRRPTP
jgi:hypothetical protein